jgi:hypothetical protein
MRKVPSKEKKQPKKAQPNNAFAAEMRKLREECWQHLSRANRLTVENAKLIEQIEELEIAIAQLQQKSLTT